MNLKSTARHLHTCTKNMNNALSNFDDIRLSQVLVSLGRYRHFLSLTMICLTVSSCGGGYIFSSESLIDRAELLASQGHPDEAIGLYRKHLERRLAVSKRPDWENPYLYLLAIGDLELEQGKVAQALQSYEEAEKRQVGDALIADRFRGVALYFEKQGKLEDACQILKTYRERDSLLFDGMLDRISKEIVAREEADLQK